MRLSYSTLACPDWSWEKAIKRAVEYGYDGIEWRLVGPDLVGKDFPLEEAAAIATTAAAQGLAIPALDSGVSLAVPPGPERERRLVEGHQLLRIAHAFGAEFLRVFPGTYDQDVPDSDAVRWVGDGLRDLQTTANETGVKIALELHNSLGWDRLRTRGTSTSSFVAQVLQDLDPAYFGVLWDLGNPYIEGETAAQTWHNIRPWLLYLHVKDLRQNTDGTWEHTAIGDGSLPIKDAMSWIMRAGFDGWASFEWEKKWHPELAEPDEVLPTYVTYMQDYR